MSRSACWTSLLLGGLCCAPAQASASLEEQVNSRLRQDAELAEVQAVARTDDHGSITLSGSVPSESAAARALQEARRVPGVAEVQAQLDVAATASAD